MFKVLKPFRRLWPQAVAVTTLGLLMSSPALAVEPIKIGLVAALSGQSAKSGEALTRGLTIAIDEINADGGILGRPVELIRRDDESNPAKGMLAARELIQREKVTVLFGGLDIGDRERCQRRATVDHLFDLEAEHGQPFGDLVERCVGLEMGFEPVEGQLHRLNPWPNVGVSSAAKP